MAGRTDRGRGLDQFRLGLDEQCSMQEAAARLAARDDAARIDAARAKHKEAMARLYAKGWRGWGRKRPN